MSRIPPLKGNEVPWSVRPILAGAKKMFGKDLTPLGVQARHPALLWATTILGMVLDKPKRLPPRLNALVNLRTAQTVGCPF